MNIVLCLDNSSFTEKVLTIVKSFVDSLKASEITVLHIIDEQLFYPTTGYEVTLDETLRNESVQLKELCIEYLGASVKYVEECGVPKLKIDEMLGQVAHDLVIAGSHSSHGLGERIMGSFA